MGTGSSVLPNEEQISTQKHRRSIRQQFHGEFGKSISVEDSRVETGVNVECKQTLTNEIGESSCGSGNQSPSGNGESPHGSRESSSGESNRSKVKFNTAVFHAKALFMKPIMKDRPEKDKLLVKKQDNHGLLKEMYRRMDPTLNDTASTRPIVGEVELAAKFKPEDSLLLIKVGRAKELSKEECSTSPDPYVVVDIFPARNPLDITTRKTKVKSGTCNPYFQEILTFPMSQQQISHTKLRITVWDRVSSSMDDFLGESVLDICKLDLNVGGIIWYKLHPKTDISLSGNLEICVTFQEPKSVVVTINRANGVKVCNEEDQSSNPYARVYITGLPNKFQTSVQNNTIDPLWMESFEFDVYPSEFSRRVIVINLLSKNKTGGRDHHLGDVHVPMADYDHQQAGIMKEYPLKDLRNTPYSKSAWSEEGLAMEFREAMKAHMIYGYPKFIFKKHTKGKKMVSCRSKKAQTQAKMVIDKGIVTMDEVEM